MKTKSENNIITDINKNCFNEVLAYAFLSVLPTFYSYALYDI